MMHNGCEGYLTVSKGTDASIALVRAQTTLTRSLSVSSWPIALSAS